MATLRDNLFDPNQVLVKETRSELTLSLMVGMDSEENEMLMSWAYIFASE